MFKKTQIIESNKFNEMQIKAIKTQLKRHCINEVLSLDYKGTGFFSTAEVVKVSFNFMGVDLTAFDIQGVFLFGTVDRSIGGVIERLDKEIALIKENFLKAIDPDINNTDLLLDFMSHQARDLKYSVLNPNFHSFVINYVNKLFADGLSKKEIFIEGMHYIFRNKHKIDIFVGNLGKVVHISDL